MSLSLLPHNFQSSVTWVRGNSGRREARSRQADRLRTDRIAHGQGARLLADFRWYELDRDGATGMPSQGRSAIVHRIEISRHLGGDQLQCPVSIVGQSRLLREAGAANYLGAEGEGSWRKRVSGGSQTRACQLCRL